MVKAPGIDNITAEEIVAVDEAGVSIYFKLFEDIWYQEQVPEDWRRVVIVPIFKKKDTTEYDNYRGLSLLYNSKKIFASVLLQNIKVRTEEILSEAQAGFRSGRSTIDQLHTLRSIADKYLEHGTDLYVCYIEKRSTVSGEKGFGKS